MLARGFRARLYRVAWFESPMATVCLADVAGVGRVNVRLAYVDAPEYDQPWGPESKKALARLVRGGEVRFRLLYRDQYARVVAVVSTPGMVVNDALVRQGHAWVYSAVCAEAAARPVRGA